MDGTQFDTNERKLYLHAGAHRTGTSSFQACLSRNRAVLEKLGYDPVYPGRDGIADGKLQLRLPPPRPRGAPDEIWARGVRTEFSRHINAPERKLVLSEENIPGRMLHFYHGQFFPAVRRRATILADNLPGKVAHLLYVIRPYDQLFISAYRKRAEDNPVPPFQKIAPLMAGMSRGWPKILQVLHRRLQPEKMTVIEYSARGMSRDLLRHLVPDLPDDIDLDEPDRDLNRSATDAALRHLQSRYHAGEKLKRAEWQAIIALHADDTARGDFAAFTAEQTAQMAERYAEHLQAIREMPFLTFIE